MNPKGTTDWPQRVLGIPEIVNCCVGGGVVCLLFWREDTWLPSSSKGHTNPKMIRIPALWRIKTLTLWKTSCPAHHRHGGNLPSPRRMWAQGTELSTHRVSLGPSQGPHLSLPQPSLLFGWSLPLTCSLSCPTCLLLSFSFLTSQMVTVYLSIWEGPESRSSENIQWLKCCSGVLWKWMRGHQIPQKKRLREKDNLLGSRNRLAYVVSLGPEAEPDWVMSLRLFGWAVFWPLKQHPPSPPLYHIRNVTILWSLSHTPLPPSFLTYIWKKLVITVCAERARKIKASHHSRRPPHLMQGGFPPLTSTQEGPRFLVF